MNKTKKTSSKGTKTLKSSKRPAQVIPADELDCVYGGIAVAATGTKNTF